MQNHPRNLLKYWHLPLNLDLLRLYENQYIYTQTMIKAIYLHTDHDKSNIFTHRPWIPQSMQNSLNICRNGYQKQKWLEDNFFVSEMEFFLELAHNSPHALQ